MLSVSELTRFWELRNLLAHYHLRYKSESPSIYLVLIQVRSINQLGPIRKWIVCAVISLIYHITVVITDDVTISHWWFMCSITSIIHNTDSKWKYLLYYTSNICNSCCLICIACLYSLLCYVDNITETLFEINLVLNVKYFT